MYAIRSYYACAHDLYIAGADYRNVPHAVLVFQLAFKYNGNNFHVIVRMCAKTATSGNVVVSYNFV